jgi:thiol-disulfide isomerase/thioredoxin
MTSGRNIFVLGAGIGLGGSLIAVVGIGLLAMFVMRHAGDFIAGSSEADELVGNPAPDFQLDSLDDGPIALAQHRDKNVVILDFWATWCGPCRQGLPIIARVATDYRDRGVVFYAVDQREAANDVRDFLTDQRLEISALLDRDGAVGNLYHVNGIPQTVIIGRDGKVREVHVGFSGDLEHRLRRELDGLLDQPEAASGQEKDSPREVGADGS